MSWAEIKTINQNLDTPLSDLKNMEDIAFFGDKSSAYRDDKVMKQLFKNKQVPNHMIVNQYVFDYGVANNLPIGDFLKKIYNIDKEVDWDSVVDLDTLGENEGALAALIDNNVASELISMCKPLQTLMVNSDKEVTIQSLVYNKKLMTNVLKETEYVEALADNEVALPILLCTDITSDLIRSKTIVYDMLWRGIEDESKLCRVLCVATDLDPDKSQTLEEVQANGEILVNILNNYTYLFNDRADLVTMIKECSGNAQKYILQDEKALSKYIVFLLKGTKNFDTDYYNEVWDTINMNNGVLSTANNDSPLKYIIASQPQLLSGKLLNSDLVIRELLDSYGSSSVLSSYISNAEIQKFAFQNTKFLDKLFENKPTLLNLLTNNGFVQYLFSNTISYNYFLEHADEDMLYKTTNVFCAYLCKLLGVTFKYTVADVLSNYYTNLQNVAKSTTTANRKIFEVMTKNRSFMDAMINNDTSNYYQIFQYAMIPGGKLDIFENSEIAMASLRSVTTANYKNRLWGYYLSAKMGLDSAIVLTNMYNDTYINTVFGVEGNTKIFFECDEAVDYYNTVSYSTLQTVLNKTYPQAEINKAGTYANDLYVNGTGQFNMLWLQKMSNGSYTTSTSYDTIDECIANGYAKLFGTNYASVVKSPRFLKLVGANETYCGYVTNSTYASKMMPKIVASTEALGALTNASYFFFKCAFFTNKSTSATYITNSTTAMNFIYGNSIALAEYIQYLYGTREYTSLANVITNYGVAISTNATILNSAIYKSNEATARLITYLALGSQVSSLSSITLAQANSIFSNLTARNILLNSPFGNNLKAYSNLYTAYLSYNIDSEVKYTSILDFYNANLDTLLEDDDEYAVICGNSALLNTIYGNDKLFGKFIAKKIGLVPSEYSSLNSMLIDEEVSPLILDNEETFNLVKSKKMVAGVSSDIFAVILSKINGNEWTTSIDDLYDNIEDETIYSEYIKLSQVALIKCLVHLLGFDSRNYSTLASIKEYGIEDKILDNPTTYAMMLLRDDVKNEIVNGKEEVIVNKLKEKYNVAHKDLDQLIRSINFVGSLSESDIITIATLKQSDIFGTTETKNLFLSTPNFLKAYARNYKTFGETFLKNYVMSSTSLIKPILNNPNHFTLHSSFTISYSNTKSFGGNIAGLVYAQVIKGYYTENSTIYGPSGNSIYTSSDDTVGKIFTPDCKGKGGYYNNGSWSASSDINVKVYVPTSVE